MHIGPEEIRNMVVIVITLVLSITVHEFGHAWVADLLGDSLPRRQGRVTLNPAAHADPIGTLLLPAASALTGIPSVGWGRPVQVQPSAMTRRLRMRTAHMLVAVAGPMMNILLAVLVGLLTLVLTRTAILNGGSPIYGALLGAMNMNCLLAFFNLIPFRPLDGGTVVEGILPQSAVPTWQQIQRYGVFVVLAFFLIPQLQVLFVVPANYVFTSLFLVLGLPLPYGL